MAYRKAMLLKDFGAEIAVVSPVISEKIKRDGQIFFREKCFEDADLDGRALVVAATDDKQLNHRIALLCRERKIAVNAVDELEDCSFIFSSYVKEGSVVAAVSSGGKSPVVAQYLRSRIRDIMTQEIGNMADFLGKLRSRIKEEVAAEAERKEAYLELLKIGLEKHQVPSKEETEGVILKYKNGKIK